MRLHVNRRKSYAFLILRIATILSLVTKSSHATCNVSCPTCPCFLSAPYNISISENLPIGQTITTFTADDPDTTDLEYSITSDAFNIDPLRGTLTVATELDFESDPVYRFRVQASDGMGRGLADVTINLMNVNEYAPQCTANVVYFSTSEGLTGDTFDLPSCTDADQPDNPTISYKIVSGNEDSNFAINQSDGSISIARALDYEDRTLYELEIAACDEHGGNGSLNSSITTIIIVEPVNEFMPTFNSPQFTFTVSETAEISTTIDHVTASDDDGGDDGTIVYSFGSNPTDVFAVDSLSGDIILTRSLDFESVGSYQFTVVATDSTHIESTRMSSSATVVVMVQDENDNHPTFSQPVYSTGVREDAVIGNQIITVLCTDLDVSDNVTYSISLGNTGSKFSVDMFTGTISLLNTLDFDDTSQTQLFEITVECSESNTPREMVEALVVIEVTSYDEFYPDPGFDYQATVSEDMSPGFSILRIEGRDRDQGPGGLLRYSLNELPACPQNLHIDSLTGILYLLSPFDYEEPPYNSHSVVCTVTVSDSEHSTEADIIVTVSNVNDVPPVCDPTVYTVNVPEDIQIGLEFLTLSCSDSDSPTLQYTILESFASPFQISPTGAMTIAEHLDYEVQSFHDITIGVSDNDYSVNVTVHVSVTGINEHPPNFRNSTFECSVVENSNVGAVVCSVTATDEDSGEDGIINYRIANGSGVETFEIDRTSGQIHLIRNIDYEINREYWFTVTANDRGSPSLSGSALVHTEVVDVNDNPPQMDVQLFYSVSEGTPSGSVVNTINCYDVDSGSNSRTRLQMSSFFLIYPNGTEVPASTWVFSINSTSGELILTGALDYEGVQFYRLSIICRDAGTPVHAAFSTVTIQVLPVNEYIPQFTESSYQLTVEELSDIGTSIATFSASDEDSGTDGEIRYSISPGANVPFAINQQTGTLSVYRRLSCTDRQVYNFTIEVRDGGSPSLQTHAFVTLNIVHCHLGELFALSNAYAASVPENAPTGTLVLTVTCNSTRAFIPGISPPLYEIILDDVDTFQIDSTTGEITVRNSPDFESHSSHMLHIQCYDPHNINIAMIITAYISITPINEHTPVFTQPSYTVSINEDTILGTRVTQVQATDADNGRDAELTYHIQDTRSFLINAQSGEIFLSASLDRESVDELTFSVTAQDNPSDHISVPRSSSTQVTVLVLDSNDHWPVCERTVYHLIVSPHTPRSSTILDSLNCSDADLGSNSLLEYFISDETLSNIFSVDRTLGQLTLLSTLDPNDSPVHHIPITVHDLGTPSFSISVLLVIEVQEPPLPERTPGDDNDHLSLVEAEGLKNTITFILNDFSKALWEDRTDAKNNFQDAIARSVTDYCALLPEACSLVSGCAEFFGHSSNGRRKRSENNYISFSEPSIIVLPNITEVTSSSFETSAVEDTTETISLQVKFYVKLPDAASRAPYRETNYVVPRATLTRIVEQDEKVIEAVVRDSVSPSLTVKAVDGWLVSGSLLLVISAILVSVMLLAGIIAVVYKYKQKQSKKIKVVPINTNRTTNPPSSRNVFIQQPHTRTRTTSTSKRDSLPTHFNFLRRNTSNNTIRRDSDTSALDGSLSDVSEISLDNEGASMENNASSKNSQLSQSQGLSSGFGDSLNTQIMIKRTNNRSTQEFGADFMDNFPYTSPHKPLQRVTIPKWSMSYGDRPNL